uniref:Uncharacterized protein n=1 Tax=Anguilla anguilla TaxID=7936 RepID=A0A0E9TS04_ANGAN
MGAWLSFRYLPKTCLDLKALLKLQRKLSLFLTSANFGH